MCSSVEVPEIWISLPDPGRGSLEPDAQIKSIVVQRMVQALLIYLQVCVPSILLKGYLL